MSVAGNKRTIYIGFQANAATLATDPVLKLRTRGVDTNPVRQIIALEETDAAAQEGGSVVAGFAPGGSLSHYLRPSEADALLYALLGDVVETGTTPNFTHTIVPIQDTPYLTIWETEPGLWTRRFKACRLTEITVQGGAGQPLEITGLRFEALGYEAHVTEPDTPADVIDESPLIYPEVTVTRGGVHGGDVDQFSLTINRGGNRQQGDNGFESSDYTLGKFAVSGQLTQVHSDDDDIRRVDTGSHTGTTPTAAIATQTLAIKATRNANLSLEFVMTKISMTTVTVAPNIDGSPLTQVIAFRTEPTTDIADNLTVVAKNQAEFVDRHEE